MLPRVRRARQGVVFDKFRLVKNFNDVVDELRRQAVNESESEHKPLIKGQRYNLPRRPEDLSEAQSESLEELP